LACCFTAVKAGNLAAYEDTDAASLVAVYRIGLAKNHPFVDGKKRAGFLALNGYRLCASQIKAIKAISAVSRPES
jgi:death-on-curing protein